jgi:hypothetical protein
VSDTQIGRDFISEQSPLTSASPSCKKVPSLRLAGLSLRYTARNYFFFKSYYRVRFVTLNAMKLGSGSFRLEKYAEILDIRVGHGPQNSLFLSTLCQIFSPCGDRGIRIVPP